MGTRSMPLISFPPPAPPRLSINPNSSVYRSPNFCSDFPPSYAAVARARWGSKFAGDVDGRSGIRSREKSRKWWSDEDEGEEDDDDDDDDKDGDGGLFGLFKEPKTIDLVLKGLGTVGWIMPNIIMSSILDSGDKGKDALIMALMIPLGQLAISLVLDNIQGSSGSRQKRKRKPSARTSRRGNKTRKKNSRSSQERAAYHPWWETDSSFSKNRKQGSSNFGGWDELDQLIDNVSDFNGSPPFVVDNSKKESNVQIE